MLLKPEKTPLPPETLSSHELSRLASCYRESLQLAAQHGCKSIAFPSISTGAYGFPVERASLVALRAIRDFIMANPDGLELIELSTFSKRDYRAYQRAYDKLFIVPEQHT